MPVLWYAKARKRLPIRWIVAGVLSVGALLFVLMLLRAQFGYCAVCPICGKLRSSVDWQLPRTDFTYHTTHAIHDSLLSKVLTAHGLSPVHTHQWDFATGGGNGVRCALGEGRALYSAAQRQDVVRFVDAILSYGTKLEIDELFSLMRDTDRTRYLETAIGISNFPADGVNNSQQYTRWRSAYRKEWDDFWAMLAEETKSSHP